MAKHEKSRLSPLENQLMDVLWQRGTATADEVRTALAKSRPLKESTVRTVLRRLEEKGFISHTVEGRTFHFTPQLGPQKIATNAVRGIIDRFCAGSVENLLVGMVDSDLLSAETLKGLADRITRIEKAQKRKRPSKGE